MFGWWGSFKLCSERKTAEKNYFEGVFIQPASGDAGGALGAALAYYHMGLLYERENSNDSDLMQGGLLGTKYSSAEIVRLLSKLAQNIK